MHKEFKKIFGGVGADEQLKKNTLLSIYGKAKKKNKLFQYIAIPKRIVLAVSLLVLLLGSGTFYLTYLLPSFRIDLDVNPAIEVSVNSFNRVIDTYAYNKDGEDVLENLELLHKNYDEAIRIIVNKMEKEGYIKDKSLLSVTLQSNSKRPEQERLTTIKQEVAEGLKEHHQAVDFDVFAVSQDLKRGAYQEGISPAKYQAILDLQTVDETASFENCRDHTIGEIKELTQQHNADHNEQHNEQHNGQHSGERKKGNAEEKDATVKNPDASSSTGKKNHHT